MQDNTFERYRSSVLRTISEIDRDANQVFFGDTLIRYYFDAGYSEVSAAAAILEVYKRHE